MFFPSEQSHVVGCVCDTCVKTWSKSQQSPRERQEEKAELFSAAVSWQQMTEDLKHWMSVKQRANRWGVLFGFAVQTQITEAIFSFCVNCIHKGK